jgi:hypothetical protein
MELPLRSESTIVFPCPHCGLYIRIPGKPVAGPGRIIWSTQVPQDEAENLLVLHERVSCPNCLTQYRPGIDYSALPMFLKEIIE